MTMLLAALEKNIRTCTLFAQHRNYRPNTAYQAVALNPLYITHY